MAEFELADLATMSGDDASVLAHAERCLAIAPASGSCMRMRGNVLRIRGDCAELEREARKMVATAPSSQRSYEWLEGALGSEGAAPATLAAAQASVVRNARESRRDLERASAAMRLGLYEGDFDAARTAALELGRVESSERSESLHVAEIALAWIARETGDARAEDRDREAILRSSPRMDRRRRARRGFELAHEALRLGVFDLRAVRRRARADRRRVAGRGSAPA